MPTNSESTEKLKQYSPYPFMAGFAAGGSIAAITFPIEGFKKWRQTPPDLRQKFRLYRGFPVFFLNIAPTTAIQFGVQAAAEDKEKSKQAFRLTPKVIGECFSSGAIGALSATVVEGCIAQQQLFKGNLYQTIKGMILTNPLRPWRSYPMIAIRDGIFTTWMFGISKRVQTELEPEYGKGVSITAAAVIGIPGALISHPVDTIASRMQQVSSFRDKGVRSPKAYAQFVEQWVAAEKERVVKLHNSDPTLFKKVETQAEGMRNYSKDIMPLLSCEKRPAYEAIVRHVIRDGIGKLWAGATARCFLFPFYMIALPKLYDTIIQYMPQNTQSSDSDINMPSVPGLR